MWELEHKEGWTPKIEWFWTVMLEKILESPLDCKEIKPVNPKEIKPENSLEGLTLKLKLQYFDYLMQQADSLEKTLMLGKIEGRRRREWQRMRWLNGINNSMDMSLSMLREMVKTGKPVVWQSMGLQWIRYNWATEQEQHKFHEDKSGSSEFYSSMQPQFLVHQISQLLLPFSC